MSSDYYSEINTVLSRNPKKRIPGLLDIVQRVKKDPTLNSKRDIFNAINEAFEQLNQEGERNLQKINDLLSSVNSQSDPSETLREIKNNLSILHLPKGESQNLWNAYNAAKNEVSNNFETLYFQRINDIDQEDEFRKHSLLKEISSDLENDSRLFNKRKVSGSLNQKFNSLHKKRQERFTSLEQKIDAIDLSNIDSCNEDLSNIYGKIKYSNLPQTDKSKLFKKHAVIQNTFSQEKVSLYTQELNSIMELSGGARIGELIGLKKKLKSDSSHFNKSILLKSIHSAFDEINDERARTKNNLESRVYASRETDVESMVKEISCISESLKKSSLTKDEKMELFNLLNDLKEEANNRLRQRDQNYLRKRFSNLSLSYSSNYFKERKDRMPSPSSRTDVRPLHSILEKVLNFGNKKAEFRGQQYQYIYSCYEGFMTGRDVVIEGPTGLGKTRALLAASVPYLLNNKKSKLIFSTRTITQVTNIIREMKDIMETDPIEGIRASFYIGAKRILEDYGKCYDAKEDFHRLNIIREEKGLKELDDTFCNVNCSKFLSPVRKTERDFLVFDGEAMSQVQSCARSVMEYLANQVNVLVVPHSYLNDSMWKEKYLEENNILIVDEAHNFLADASNQPFLSFTKSNEESFGSANRGSNEYSIHQMVTDFLESYNKEVMKRGGFIYHDGIDLRDVALNTSLMYTEFEEMVHKTEMTQIDDSSFVCEDLGNLVKDMSCFTENIMKSAKFVRDCLDKEVLSEKFAESFMYSQLQLYDSLLEILKNPEDFILTQKNDSFQFISLHPKKNVERAMDGFESAVFTSATISPVTEVGEIMGLVDPLTISIDPVFPTKNFCNFYTVGLNSSSKEELKERTNVFLQEEKKGLHSLLEAILTGAKGRNIGIFCNSIPGVIATHDVLMGCKGVQDALVLPYIQGEAYLNQKKKFEKFCQDQIRQPFFEYTDSFLINAFKRQAESQNTAILLGVQGGTLSEGVDFKGKEMEVVLAVGLPYPSSAAERYINAQKMDYFGMIGFDRNTAEDLSYKHEAFRKLAQSLGRANRSMTDQSVLICADERLLAVKGVASCDRGYEFLSAYNAKKNRSLLQKQIQDLDKNIVIMRDGPDIDSAVDYIKKSSKLNTSDFINFQGLENKMRGFFKA